jgi:type IV pilus assembly protein PilA
MRNTMNTVKRNLSQADHEAGFTLIELLIVMSVMLILMVMVIPSAMKMVRSANQTSAVQTVRTIGNAETQYASAYPQNGFTCSLAALGGAPGSGAPSAQAAQILDANLAASGTKSGYTFTITNCGKVTVNNVDQYNSFEVIATPNQVGKTGDRSFCMDQESSIKFDPAGGTNCTQPLGQ